MGKHLDNRKTVDRLEGEDLFRAFVTVQLQDIRLQQIDDIVEVVTIGIDGNRHDLGPAPRLLGNPPGNVRLDIPGALFEEDEADMGGAKSNGLFDGLLGLQSANFDISFMVSEVT